MIAGRLLARGMVAGCIAAALAFVFARIFGEPQVDLAIAFEATRHAAVAALTPLPVAQCSAERRPAHKCHLRRSP